MIYNNTFKVKLFSFNSKKQEKESGHVSQILLGSTLVFLLYEFYCLYFNFLGNETGLLGSISESS